MIEANDFTLALADVIEVLEQNKLHFHLTGGLASSYYGEPRFTQDIDIVVRISSGMPLDQFISDLSKKFIVDNEAIIEAVRRNKLFQALHEETMIKIDFHVGEAISGELERSKKVEIFSNIIIPLVSKEDAILSKLIWVSKGSHKSRQDIKMMLKLQVINASNQIDFGYLNLQAVKLGVQELLNEIIKEIKAE